MSLMFCSTSHRQRGVRLLLLVAGAVLACVSLYFFRAFFCLFVFAFYGLLCRNCVTEAPERLFIFFSLSLSLSLLFCFPPVSFFCCFAEKYNADLKKKNLFYFTLLLLLLSMQVMIALRFYATGTFQRVIGDSFGVSL